jgi:hypothetical protein
MVGTDRWVVHSFAAPFESGPPLQTQAACRYSSGLAPPLRGRLVSLVGRATPGGAIVSSVHNTASPENDRDWHNYLLAADQQAYSVVAITFKFSVAALLSLVPGRASSTNQLVFGTRPA